MKYCGFKTSDTSSLLWKSPGVVSGWYALPKTFEKDNHDVSTISWVNDFTVIAILHRACKMIKILILPPSDLSLDAAPHIREWGFCLFASHRTCTLGWEGFLRRVEQSDKVVLWLWILEANGQQSVIVIICLLKIVKSYKNCTLGSFDKGRNGL